METTNIDQISEFQNLDIDEDGFVLVSEGEVKSVNMLNILSEELSENYDDKSIENQILKIEKDFKHWTELRRITISNLRDIADYIDSVTKKTGIVKAIGSGGGAIGGGLTMLGGILTIATAGAALPVLIAGTSIGLASGIGGGAAAVTEKIIKSNQLKQAKESIDADKEATSHLEEDIAKLRSNKKVVNKIAKDVIMSGGSAAYDSVYIFNLVAGKAGAANTLKAGIEATAQLLGEDVGKEVSKILLHTSGRVLSGGITVVFGSITMVYDIYKLSTEMEAIATKKDGDELREIANQLEIALDSFLSGCDDQSSIQSTCDKINHNDGSIQKTSVKPDLSDEVDEETSTTNFKGAILQDNKSKSS